MSILEESLLCYWRMAAILILPTILMTTCCCIKKKSKKDKPIEPTIQTKSPAQSEQISKDPRSTSDSDRTAEAEPNTVVDCCTKEKVNKMKEGITVTRKDPNYASLKGIISDWSTTESQSYHETDHLLEDETQQSSRTDK